MENTIREMKKSLDETLRAIEQLNQENPLELTRVVNLTADLGTCINFIEGLKDSGIDIDARFNNKVEGFTLKEVSRILNTSSPIKWNVKSETTSFSLYPILPDYKDFGGDVRLISTTKNGDLELDIMELED